MYLADRAQAEDALQDTFLKAWRSMDAFEARNGASEKTWILKIAINTCKNYRRGAWFRHIDKTKIIEELPAAVTGVTEESRDMFLSVMMLEDKLITGRVTVRNRRIVDAEFLHISATENIGLSTGVLTGRQAYGAFCSGTPAGRELRLVYRLENGVAAPVWITVRKEVQGR